MQLVEEALPPVEGATAKARSVLDSLIRGSIAWIEFVTRDDVRRILLVDGPTVLGWQRWQALALRLPLFGGLLLKYELTLFSRSFGTLLGNGVPLLSSLQIATQTIGNTNLRFALEGVAPKVKGGAKLVDALQASGIFEPLALSLIRVGEETGRMGTMLLELARIFNRDVEAGIKRGLTLLEPLLIVVLGLLIAAIIVSILLGILSVNDLAV